MSIFCVWSISPETGLQLQDFQKVQKRKIGKSVLQYFFFFNLIKGNKKSIGMTRNRLLSNQQYNTSGEDLSLKVQFIRDQQHL